MLGEQTLRSAWKLLQHKRAPQWGLVLATLIGVVLGAAGGITINNNVATQNQNGASPAPTLTATVTATATATVTATETVTTTITTGPPPTNGPADTGRVSLSTLCHAPNATLSSAFSSDGCLPDGVYAAVVGSIDFPYDMKFPANIDQETGLSFPSTTCNSVDLDFAISPDDRFPGMSIMMMVVQQNTKLQSVSISYSTKRHLHAILDGGPWAIAAKSSERVTGEVTVLASGIAHCKSADGS